MRRLGAPLVILCAGLGLAGCVSTSNEGLTPAAVTAANTIPPVPPPGTIVAGVVGASIGTDLTTADQQMALSAEYQALEYGTPGATTHWQSQTNPNIFGDVVPGPFYSVNEYTCRDYTHTISNNGVIEAGRGSSCRINDGPWGPVI